MAVLSIKDGNGIVDAVINAVVAGYRDDLILEELASAVEDEKITQQQFQSAVEGLKLYSSRFVDTINSIAESMAQFEFNEKTSIIKNRPMNLAQQVMQDVDGFNAAADEYYTQEEDISEEDATKAEPEPKEEEVETESKEEETEETDSGEEEKEADIKKPSEEEKAGK